MYFSTFCIISPQWCGMKGEEDGWMVRWREGKVGLAAGEEGWMEGSPRNKEARISLLWAHHQPPLLFTIQDKGVEHCELKLHTRCTFECAPMCTLVHSARLCIVGASVRVEGGHYTNHRGDTLGASPKTRERETGMKNFEMINIKKTVHKNKLVYDQSLLGVKCIVW